MLNLVLINRFHVPIINWLNFVLHENLLRPIGSNFYRFSVASAQNFLVSLIIAKRGNRNLAFPKERGASKGGSCAFQPSDVKPTLILGNFSIAEQYGRHRTSGDGLCNVRSSAGGRRRKFIAIY